MDWLTQFATDRAERLNDFDVDIRPIVETSLAGWTESGNWYDDIVTGATVLWHEIFEKTSPGEDPSTPAETFMRELGESLAKTSEPADPPSEGQIDRVARWVGVYTVNSATYHASRAGGELEKTWIDMEDAKVRPTHRAVGGQTVPILGTFDVGGYKLHFPGEPEGPPEIWINCRCLLATSGGETMATKIANFALAAPPEEGELTDEDLENEDLVDDDTETPWHGVLVVEGKPTGDKRMFEVGALTYRNLPLPLSFQRVSAEGHMQSIVVGRIDTIELVGDEHRATGAFNLNVPEAHEVIDGLIFGSLGGVSVDVDMAEFEVDFKETDGEDDGDLMGMLFGEVEMTRFTAGRIAGATVVSIPAFQEAYVALGLDFEDAVRDPEAGVGDADPEEGEADAEDEALVAAAFAPGTHDGPGWITHPRATQRLRSYWVHGKGAAKIRWGMPGDFNRCRSQLGKYVNPAFLAGTCANLHKEALKVWPGRESGKKHSIDSASPAFSLVAAAFEVDPEDHGFFANPEFEVATPLTIDSDGHVYGHIAQWGTCHVGIGERCIMPPHSLADYAHFLRGVVETTEGPVRTGPLVMWTGHAGSRQSAAAATKHYDDTGHAVADIAVGEDGIGIWFSGKLRDGVTQEDIKVLRATGTVSGDWRDPAMSGVPTELVGLIAVNVPGYPMPRPSFAMDGLDQLSLTASGGILAPRKAITASAGGGFVTAEDLEAVGRIVADELEYRAERKERLATVRDPELVERANSRRAERIAAARSLEG